MGAWRDGCGCLAVWGLWITVASAGSAVAQELDEIEVIGVTPVHGSGVPIERIPANVQLLDSRDLDRGGLDLSDSMNRRLGSVNLNAVQNNPLQPDVQYRGFTASPLLGLPQGIAIYGDGVRLNTPFGDAVHWDTIPQQAIDTINLFPGSNPLFGLNTLGGALSVSTKDGFDYQENRVSLMGGSDDRWDLKAETGRQHGDWAHYLALRYFEEDGWRDHSPSEVTSLFGKLSWRSDESRLDLGLNLADNDLIGNGAAPIELLDDDREAIFTRPDRTENEMFAITLSGDTLLSEETILAGNVYYRKHDISALNGDDSDIEECEDTPGFLCIEDDDEEEIVVDADDDPIAADEALEGATVNTSETDQDSYGLSLQLNMLGNLGGRENQLIVGSAFDEGRAHYRAKTELGALDDTRRAIGGGVIDGESFVDVKTKTRNLSLFFSDSLSVTERVTLNLAGRWNRTRVELDDQIGTALNGDHSFTRFNPSAGLNYAIGPDTRVYGSYSESTRAPTPVELTCADPDDPCRLPNAFVADPPLKQVVAKTFEVGASGRSAGIDWQVSAFTTTNRDDIIFISSGALTSEGYFDNIGDTRRRGIELGLSGSGLGDRLAWFANYAYLEATFRSTFKAPSENHPEAVDGEITVKKGDTIPGIPEHLLKLGGDYRLTPSLTIGGELVYNAEQYLRGDESNQLDRIDDFTVVNLHGRYRLNDTFSIIAKVDNLFDTEYESFGALGEPEEVLGDDFEDPRFLGPGAPRGVWIGMEARF